MSRSVPFSPEHPLGSACLKIRRANIHIHSLNAAIRRSSRKPEITVVGQGEVNTPSKIPEVISEPVYVYEVDIDPRISSSWALIVGDILGNLRASLDHVAWALAMEYTTDQRIILTERQKRSIDFPLYMAQDKKPFLGGLPERAIHFVPPKAQNIIEGFQPYNRAKRPELKLLGVLAELTNEDKHRVVIPVLRDIGYRLTGFDPFIRVRLNEPDKHVIGVSARDQLKPEAAFDVVLSVPFLRPDYFRVSDFRLVHDLIRDEVLPAFAHFFPEC